MAIGPVYGCLLAAARERGVDVDVVLRSFGLEEAQLAGGQVRLSPEADDLLGRELSRRARRPGLGLAAADRFEVKDLELFGYLLKSADNLAQVFALMQRYARLIGDSAACSLCWEGERAAVVVDRTGGRVYSDEMTDFVVGVVVRIVRELAPRGVRLLEVRLRRAPPRDRRPLQTFFDAPIRFQMSSGSLLFTADSLTAPVVTADPVLARILRAHADWQMSQLIPDAAIRERVRAALARQVSRGTWAISGVARQLGMSPRTLRRRLQEEKSSFRTLVDDMRRERALLFAEAGRHNATEIALMLGFADTTSLARAFRRWTGTSPRAFFKQARTTAGSPSAR